MNSNNSDPRKAALCIREMAAQCGLSRQRFMQLVKAGVFPAPLHDEATGRPYFSEELQCRCLEVRRRNMGVNGKVVMFYAHRTGTPKARKSTSSKPEHHADLLAGLKALGLTATSVQVAAAVKELFPQGTPGDAGEVVRAVFLHLHRKNSAGNVGRKE